VFVRIKHIKKKCQQGLEPTYLVSEEYWYGALSGLATTDYSRNLPCSQHPSFAAELASHMSWKINEL
jgi:hypothetical protein